MSRKSREMAAQAASEAGQAAQAVQLEAPQAEAASESSGDNAQQQIVSPVKVRNEPRRRMIEELEAAEQSRQAGDRPAPTSAEPVAATAPEPTAELPAAAPEDAAAQQPTEPVVEAAPMVKVKVDGQEFEVPQADVDAAGGIRAYQMEKASENRLSKANQALAETRQLQALIAQHAQQTLQPPAPQLTPAQFIAERMEKVRFGTEQESAQAMQEILQFQQPDTAAIEQRAVTTMMKNMAVDNFKKEFQDIVANPLLLQLASTLENQRAAKLGPQADWNTFYRSIGNEVRSVTGMRGTAAPSASSGQSQPSAAQTAGTALATPAAQQTSDATSQSPSEREARKASIVNLPTAAARAAMPDNKPETREDILNSMRKSRGLPVG